MAAFSGLFNGFHGENYTDLPKSDALPPHSRGIIRTFMQRRAMHGHVEALRATGDAARTRINADRQDITVPGTFTYATWKADKFTPGAGIARDVTVSNAGSHVNPTTVSETIARPTSATGNNLSKTYDTTIKTGYVADASGIPVTSPAVTGVVAT